MAGDWIKMRTQLDLNPKVIEMAAELGIPELHVVGCLWKLWSWADSQTVDGNAIRVTCVTLDRFTCVTGFADALRKVGWLEGRDNALTFPRFAEHNGQTAKKRCETKERVAKHRNAKSVTDVTQKALPEKRREEKSNKKNTKKKTVDKPEGVNEQTWNDFLEHRKAKKAVVTETAMKRIVSEAAKAGMELESVLVIMCQRGWTGFEAEWVNKLVQVEIDDRPPMPRCPPREVDEDPRWVYSGQTGYQWVGPGRCPYKGFD